MVISIFWNSEQQMSIKFEIIMVCKPYRSRGIWVAFNFMSEGVSNPRHSSNRFCTNWYIFLLAWICLSLNLGLWCGYKTWCGRNPSSYNSCKEGNVRNMHYSLMIRTKMSISSLMRMQMDFSNFYGKARIKRELKIPYNPYIKG